MFLIRLWGMSVESSRVSVNANFIGFFSRKKTPSLLPHLLLQGGAYPVPRPVIHGKPEVAGGEVEFVHFLGDIFRPADRGRSRVGMRPHEPSAQTQAEEHQVAQPSLQPRHPVLVSGDPFDVGGTAEENGGRLPVRAG